MNSLGPLQLALPKRKVLDLLGYPEAKSKPVVWAADSEVHLSWCYHSRGIAVGMIGEGNDQNIDTITPQFNRVSCKQPETYASAAYMRWFSRHTVKEIDRSVESSDTVVKGSVYRGIFFRFRNNRVSEIFSGATGMLMGMQGGRGC